MRSLLMAALMAAVATVPARAQTEGGGEGSAPAAETSSYDASTVLATVNGTDITLGNVAVMRQRLPAQYAGLPDEVLLPGLLEQLVDQELLAGTIEGEGEDPLEVRLQVENERRGALAARAAREATAEVSEDAVQAAYDAAFPGGTGQTEYNASHILVDSEEKAQELKEEIDAGADFAEVAKANSTDGTAPAGGELGWFGQGQMVPAFETAVADMEVGEVVGPVQTEFGWHLIKLNDTREATPPPLEQVRPEIEQQLAQEALQAEVARLRSEATIEMPDTGIPASAISDTSILEN